MEQPLILDRYRPLTDLGQGAFGSVVLAWDTRMQRRVAIKRLVLPVDSHGEPLRRAGLGEARTAAMLSHPNIVTVFDFDADSDEAFLIMEHVDGASLAEVLDEVDGRLDADELASVLHDVSQALVFAHDNGVLHLDIKPENVLIGIDGRAKVADFGIARLSAREGHGSADAGTVGYMPPEQLRGSDVTQQTDEWSLAAMVYEAATGDNPFAGESVADALRQAETASPSLSLLREAGLAVVSDDVFGIALDPDPAQRYESVTHFADELAPLLGDPAAGRESLADIVAEFAEGTDHFPASARIGLWDRAGGRAGLAFVRVAAAAEAGWLTWTGLAPLLLDAPASLAATALVAAAAVLAPSLGVGLGLGCFIVGLFAAGWWPAGVAVALVFGAWWWLFARRSPGSAVLPLAAPALAAARIGLAQPLIAGFSLPPLRAAVTALLGGVLALLASAASANPVPYLAVSPAYALDLWSTRLGAASVMELASSPAAYVALLGWPLAALVASVGSRGATRVGAAMGTIGGGAILGGAYYLAERVAVSTGSATGYTGRGLTIGLSASLILMTLVITLGAPLRAEEEDPLATSPEDYEDD